MRKDIRVLLAISISFALLSCGCSSRMVAATPEESGTLKVERESSTTSQIASSAASEDTSSDVTVQAQDAWKLILVNDRNTIPETFAPELEEVQGAYQMDRRVAPILRQMIADAKKQGIDLFVCSAYRPYSSQKRNFDASVQRYTQAGYTREQAEKETLRLIAAPGSSEHQTGLSADIVTPTYQGLDDGYANTDAARWLKANAASYGFILRYPQDKTEITHIDFEPWHYRYVGEEAAKLIMEQEICLEEYLDDAQS